MGLYDFQYWMNKAIEQAKKGNSAFGAVIVNDTNQYIEAFNTTNIDGPTAHAEVNAIQKLKQLDYSNTEKLTLYSTV